jgi:predicted dehydrogenase
VPGAADRGSVGSGGDLRVALVGYGLSGRVFHAPLIAASPGLELVTVVTSDAGRRVQVGEELPGVCLLARARELWRMAAEHDLVVVATPTGTHRSLAGAALRSGLATVVEKPLSTSLVQVRALAQTAGRTGVPLFPFHNRRWDSDHLTLRRLLAEKRLGRVLRYESRFERFQPRPDPAAWRQNLPARSGGGVLLDLGVHLVDQALQLFGPPARVYAEIEARRGRADDDVFVAIEHRRGVRSHLWAGALAAAPGPRLRVLGTEAAFVVAGLDGQEAALRADHRADAPGFGSEPPERWGALRRGHGVGAEPVPSEAGNWLAFYRGVNEALRGTAPTPVPIEDALAVAAVLDAARTSARRRRVVEL